MNKAVLKAFAIFTGNMCAGVLSNVSMQLY